MSKKTLIVTGASGNMGQAVIKKFLQKGFNVLGTAVAGDPVNIEINNDNFNKVEADLLNEAATDQFVSDAIQQYGKIDVLVTTVGGFAMGSIAETSSADILKQYRLNFETAYNIVRPIFVQMMKQKSGRIFLVGSKPGLNARDGKGMVAYGLGKSLVFRLAELLNEEAKGSEVVTSVLVPGTIDTAQNRKAMSGADFNNWVTPDAIASAIYFYCTEDAIAIREPVIKLYNNS